MGPAAFADGKLVTRKSHRKKLDPGALPIESEARGGEYGSLGLQLNPLRRLEWKRGMGCRVWGLSRDHGIGGVIIKIDDDDGDNYYSYSLLGANPRQPQC